MRATGTLAGVEFLAPPAYHSQDKEWREVITESGYFFTKSAARFFGSRVSWDTLTAIPSGYLFITSETSDTPRRYTLRSWDSVRGVHSVGEFMEHATLAAAKKALNNYLTNNN